MQIMKLRNWLLLLWTIPTQLVFCQSIIAVSYDASGNRLAKKLQGSSPNPTVVATPTAVSLSQASTLTASGCPGTVKWSNGQTGASISVTPTATTQYSVSCVTANCPANGIGQVTVEVFQCQPDVIGVASTLYTTRYGQSVTLTAYGCSGTVNWSNGQTGFTTTAQVYGSPDTFTAYCSKRNCPSSGVGSVSITGVISCAPGEVMVTIQTGNWNTPATWQCGRLPALNEEVLIRHVVTVDGVDSRAGKINARSLTLSGGYVIQQDGGFVNLQPN